MANFLIQKSTRDLSNDTTYQRLNHYDYRHHLSYRGGVRIDYLQHRQDNSVRFYADERLTIFYLGNLFFDQGRPLERIRELHLAGQSLTDHIISGNFIIGLHDLESGEVLVANDRFGFSPAYVYTDTDSTIISSEVKGILHSPTRTKTLTLNPAGFANRVRYDYFLGAKTFFKEINKLEPGNSLRLTEDGVHSRPYWRWNADFDQRLTPALTAELNASFQAGLHLQQNQYPGRYCYDLSGGYDTRFIYLNAPEARHVMTYGDEHNIEYRIVEKILALKPAELIAVKTKLSVDSLEQLANLNDCSASIFSTHSVDFLNAMAAGHPEFTHVYDGLLGEVLAGKYLMERIDLLNEFGWPASYDANVFKVGDLNSEIFKLEWLKELERHDDLDAEISRHTILAPDGRIDYARSRVSFMFHNDGLNRTLHQGTVVRSRYATRCLPLYYYPFFDLYTQISLKDLRLKKAYTRLYEIFDWRMRSVPDEFFRLPFWLPQKTRILGAAVNQILQRSGLYRPLNYFDYSADFAASTELKDYFHAQLTGPHGAAIVAKDQLEKILGDPGLCAANYKYLNRALGLVLFIKENARHADHLF